MTMIIMVMTVASMAKEALYAERRALQVRGTGMSFLCLFTTKVVSLSSVMKKLQH